MRELLRVGRFFVALVLDGEGGQTTVRGIFGAPSLFRIT
jgi:hypothetical protein